MEICHFISLKVNSENSRETINKIRGLDDAVRDETRIESSNHKEFE